MKSKIILLIVILFYGCHSSSEPQQSPSISFKVDGQLFVPPNLPNAVQVLLDTGTGGLWIAAYSGLGPGSNFTLEGEYISDTGTFLFTDGLSSGEYYTDGAHFYRTEDSLPGGSLHITAYDTATQRISGTFAMDLALLDINGEPTDSSSIIHITDGQFNLQYTPEP